MASLVQPLLPQLRRVLRGHRHLLGAHADRLPTGTRQPHDAQFPLGHAFGIERDPSGKFLGRERNAKPWCRPRSLRHRCGVAGVSDTRREGALALAQFALAASFLPQSAGSGLCGRTNRPRSGGSDHDGPDDYGRESARWCAERHGRSPAPRGCRTGRVVNVLRARIFGHRQKIHPQHDWIPWRFHFHSCHRRQATLSVRHPLATPGLQSPASDASVIPSCPPPNCKSI